MRYLYLSIICCFAAFKSFAQTDSSKTTLTLAAIYSTNANYYGQTGEEKLPYVLTNATVRFPVGLYFSGSVYKLLNTTTGSSAVSAGDLSAGLEFNLSKKVTANLSYSHSFFPSNSPMLKAGNNNNASASLSYAWWLTTGLNVDYAFGTQEDVFATFSTSKQINLGSFTEKDVITFSPAIEIVGGTQRFYQTYITEKSKRDKLLGKISNPLFPPDNTTTTTTTATPSFDLLSYNLKLPLAYNRANYVVETSCQLSVLGQKVEASSSKPNSFFNLSFYYQF